MGAAMLSTELDRLGFRLTIEEEHLRVQPASALTETDRAIIREHRGETIQFLCTRDASDASVDGLMPISATMRG